MTPGNVLHLVGSEWRSVSEIRKAGETINGERYRRLIKLKWAIVDKCPEFATKYESIILHHEYARPHVARPVKSNLENSGWEVLSHSVVIDPIYNINIGFKIRY